MTLRRFSSRTHRLDQSFLAEQLKGAKSYRRIAGYFTSSLFEVANEWLETIPDVKIVCNVIFIQMILKWHSAEKLRCWDAGMQIQLKLKLY